VLGGLAAVAGGGKFAIGAITGAFGYIFNYAGNPADWAPAAGLVPTLVDGLVGLISPAVILTTGLVAAACVAICPTSTAADDNGPQSVTLYRSIGAPELADILKTGQFNFPPNGSEMKQFWLTQGDAQNFAAIMNNLLGTNEYAHMVSVEVQQSTFAAGVPGTDPLYGTLRPYVTYDMTTLPLVNTDARMNGIKVLK
jgi:hypothetical protein